MRGAGRRWQSWSVLQTDKYTLRAHLRNGREDGGSRCGGGARLGQTAIYQDLVPVEIGPSCRFPSPSRAKEQVCLSFVARDRLAIFHHSPARPNYRSVLACPIL
jgi:hypothetical protein